MAYDNNVTGVINRALAYIGEQRITNCDNPETPAGRMMVDSYDMCRREILRRVRWNFAESWAALNYAAPAPVGFDYIDTYALPADYIRLIDIYASQVLNTLGPVDVVQQYRLITVNGQRVLALNNNTATTLNISYVADITNLTLWDPLALKCLTGWLAMDAAKAITGMDSLVQQLNQMLTMDLQDAAGVNGNEQRKLRYTFSNVKRDRDAAFLGSPYWFTQVVGYQETP